MINQILDTIIPKNEKLGMPSAASIDFRTHKSKENIENLFKDVIKEVIDFTDRQYSKSFEELNFEERLFIINKIRINNIKLYSCFIKHVFNVYYSNKMVMKQIIKNSKKVFKNNHIEDWSLTSSVLKRGIKYKKII